MKTLKLLGIAALAALIVFGVTACGDPETKELEANDLKVYSQYGPYAGKQLTAAWNGDEDVTYEWFLDDVSAGAASETANTYTPSKAGTVKLVLVAKDFEPLNKYITIEAAPAHIDYIGTWEMNSTAENENKEWFTASNGANNVAADANETVIITKDHYRLESSKQSGDPKKNEFFYMTISKAEAKTGTSSVDSAYTTGGIVLTGDFDPDSTTGQFGGYQLPTITSTSPAEKGFTLFLNADKTKHVSDRNNIKRYYTRKVVPIYL